MNPKSRVRTHKDIGDALYLLRRFHIPLKTNGQTFFVVENEQFFLQEGFAYELNNSKYHSVRNNGDESRIHLIVDLLPNEYLSGVSFT
jgi:aspartyl/asparaginyl beta-hydroxylase (cupin superfamily)